MGSNDNPIRLDLNNPIFQEHLFALKKAGTFGRDWHSEKNPANELGAAVPRQRFEVGKNSQCEATAGRRCHLLLAHHPVSPVYRLSRRGFHAAFDRGPWPRQHLPAKV